MTDELAEIDLTEDEVDTMMRDGTPVDILDQIDHVVDDWDTSPDAMRWVPEKPEEAVIRWEDLLGGYMRRRLRGVLDRGVPAEEWIADVQDDINRQIRDQLYFQNNAQSTPPAIVTDDDGVQWIHAPRIT